MRAAGWTLIAVLISSALTFLVMFDHFTGRMPWHVPLSKHVIRATLHSGILKEDREIIIHLPRQYDSSALYPVMYVLDGGTEDQYIASKFEVLSSAGYAPEAIVVGIPNISAESRERDLVPAFMRIDAEDPKSLPGDGDRFLEFMKTELFPFIEKNFQASHERLISGNSRAGLLVAYSLMYDPEMFKARFCYSTPFWRQEYLLITQLRSFLESRDTLDTFLYLTAGSNETNNIKSGLDRIASMLREENIMGLRWHAEVTQNAVHADNARISSAAAIARWSEFRRNN